MHFAALKPAIPANLECACSMYSQLNKLAIHQDSSFLHWETAILFANSLRGATLWPIWSFEKASYKVRKKRLSLRFFRFRCFLLKKSPNSCQTPTKPILHHQPNSIYDEGISPNVFLALKVPFPTPSLARLYWLTFMYINTSWELTLSLVGKAGKSSSSKSAGCFKRGYMIIVSCFGYASDNL